MGDKRDMAFIKANPTRMFPLISRIFCKLSTQNSKNRSKQLYSPAHESSTMISHIKAKGNPETGELMSPIDYFKSHYHKPSGWQNEYTQEKYGVRNGLKRPDFSLRNVTGVLLCRGLAAEAAGIEWLDLGVFHGQGGEQQWWLDEQMGGGSPFGELADGALPGLMGRKKRELRDFGEIRKNGGHVS
ncbi:hypothetical protein PanWU01x14_361460 [Parasponia andersonii]|uniref:Uncharacterized protein n=1 Tax=Parasponia andersonii TaxID=3476 RepID=A0A2P5A795_PARAD|nr:hypothetical protein PanWU01x14_361460 [Parasponia andersonii]